MDERDDYKLTDAHTQQPKITPSSNLDTSVAPPEAVPNMNSGQNNYVNQPPNNISKISHKRLIYIFLAVVIVIGLIGSVLWKELTNKAVINILTSKEKTELTNKIEPDMDFVAPAGWTEKIESSGNKITKTFTSSDASGANLKLIMQEVSNRTKKDDLIPVGQKKEVLMKSALYADQYTTEYKGASSLVTSFQLRVHFDVIMEDKYYSQQKYQQVYQKFLDSFVPNGTTNNQ